MASPRRSTRLSERYSVGSNADEFPSTPAATAFSPGRTMRSHIKPESIYGNVVANGSARSNSTLPSPTQYSSEDELSTAPTSSAQTPIESSLKAVGQTPARAGLSNMYLGFRSASSLPRLEVDLPDINANEVSSSVASDSAQALSKSKFSLASDRKRRRPAGRHDIDDDFADDFIDIDTIQSRVANDAMIAKKLQAEEDMRLTKPETNPFELGTIPRSLPRIPNEAESWELSSDLDTSSSRPAKKSRSAIWSPAVTDSSSSGAHSSSRTRSGRFKSEPVKSTSADELESNPDTAKSGSSTLSTAIAPQPPSIPGQVKNYQDRDSKPNANQIATPYVYDEDDSDDSHTSYDEDFPLSITRESRRQYRDYKSKKRALNDRDRLEEQHPLLKTMWTDLEKMDTLKAGRADQPVTISRNLKPFQLEGLAWLTAMEKTQWKGGLLGDEMGLGKTIQAVSLIMSDYPAKLPTLVLVPPVALFQWTSEIASYTDGCLKTLVYHRTNAKIKNLTLKDIRSYDVIMMSYNSLESMYRKQERGFSRNDGVYKEESLIHRIRFHRVILDEAHCIKTRSTMTAKACFALKADFRWCLSGTPLQNRIGEFFSLLRFLRFEPFANYICRDCSCSKMEWTVDEENYCSNCKHSGMRHLSVFNQELLNPIQRYGNLGPGREAFRKLRLLTDRIMLRRLKKDHTDSMELPVKRIVVDRQFFSEIETDFANSIMTNSERKFNTYVENGVFLNNYANIFGLIMQMRQVADHPDLILKKNSEGSQNVMICSICDEPAEEAIQSRCRHDFCRECARSYLNATDQPDCPRCHISLAIDLEQPDREQDLIQVKKSSIINRIRMSNWTSSSKIELLVYNLYRLRSEKASHKSIIFSQFTTMLQLIEWRLRRAGITTVMLDGSMSPAQRQASIDYFKNNVDVECFLVSLKAGGVALNLTEASRVFIVDPWWNPAAEWQSADRCHRIGQTRPCVVTRLCIEDSVESRMVLLQEKKSRMINSTINSDDAAMESLTPEDLQFLFRGS